MALMSIEVGLEGSDGGQGLPEIKDGIGHSDWRHSYSSEGGRLFLKVICPSPPLFCSSDGYI